MRASPPWLGIALGDVTGIGPEVVLKALQTLAPEPGAGWVILGDSPFLRAFQRRSGLELPIQEGWPGPEAAPGIYLHDPGLPRLDVSLPHGSPEAASAATGWLREGARLCLEGRLAGLVTAPVSKEAIVRAGNPDFVGQTEFLTGLAGNPETAMMLLGHDDRGRWLRVALATTHVPIRDVAQRLTIPGIERAIRLASRACAELRLPRARVAVCGLNPHAGESGKIGDEEIRIIAPAVASTRAQGLDVTGPVSADALFHHAYRGDYDAVVAMYHDQGLAPLKMVAFEHGVNWTLGLPFVRTSPDHGTAYDIAGRNLANPSSMIAALKLARQLIAAR